MAAGILCGSGFAVLKPERRRFEAPVEGRGSMLTSGSGSAPAAAAARGGEQEIRLVRIGQADSGGDDCGFP